MSKRLCHSLILLLTLAIFVGGLGFLPRDLYAAATPGSPSGGGGDNIYKNAPGIVGCIAGTIIGPAASALMGKINNFFGFTSIGAAAGQGATESAISVPVIDRSNLTQNTIQAQVLSVLMGKEMSADGIFYCVAKVIIRELTNEIVAWINGGFSGNPAFVSNPGQLFANIADQTAEGFLGGTALEFLCSPFNIQVRLALNLNYNNSPGQKQCTWSDVAGNIGNAAGDAMKTFTGGDFSQGGWPGWFNLTQNTTNDPYGSFLKLNSDLDVKIGGKQLINSAKLDWGRGFLSYCSDVDKNPDGSCAEGKIQTPGSVIEAQLNAALPTDLQSLVDADEINEVISALVTQLLIGKHGIFSASGGQGGLSNPDYQSDPAVPELEGGTFCEGTPTIATPNDSVTWRVVTDMEAPEISWSGSEALTGDTLAITKRYKTNGVKTAQVHLISATDGEDTFTCTVSIVDIIDGNACVPVEKKNVALQKTASESHTYTEHGGSGGPGAANNGVDTPCTNDGKCASISDPTTNEPNPWWEVDLEDSIEINNLIITQRGRNPLSTAAGPSLYIFISDNPLPRRKTPAQIKATNGVTTKVINGPDTEETPIKVDIGAVKGRYVRVMQAKSDFLEMVEVEVMGTIRKDCPVDVPPNPNPNPNPTPYPTGAVTCKAPIPTGEVVNISSFGATPNDNSDDSGAIRNALAAAVGKTLVFDKPGIYNVNSTVKIPSNTNMQSISNLLGGDVTFLTMGSNHLFSFNHGSSNLKVSNLKFDGGGIELEGELHNVSVMNSIFTHFNRTRGWCGPGDALGGSSNLIGARIVNNRFIDANGAHPFCNWRIQNVVFTDNDFYGTGGGFKSNNQGNTSTGVYIARNYWYDNRRMPAELQGAYDGMIFEDNYYEKPHFESSNFHDNDSMLGWSIPGFGPNNKNNLFRRNTFLAPERPDGTGVRLMIEGGNGDTIEDNYVNGVGTMASCYSDGLPSYIRNNKMIDAKYGQGQGWGPTGNQCFYSNNNPNVQLTWDINRPKPGPCKLDGGVPTTSIP